MHPKYLSILKCPGTGESLELKIEEQSVKGMVKTGTLTNQSRTKTYPIINFIPRFVEKEYYSSSFGYEWERWPRVQFEAENVGRAMANHTTNMFFGLTGFTGEDIKNNMIVEFGCGPGRFLDIIQSRGGTAVGIDMSMAVEVARKNFENNADVLIVQGDVLNPPFQANSFDHGYTIGVLHHTNNPSLGLKKLIEIVKPGGKVACCVYHTKGLYNYFSVWLFRKVHSLFSHVLGHTLANKIFVGYSYFSAYVLYKVFYPLRKNKFTRQIINVIDRYFLVTVYLPDVRWRILDTFDAINPYYASTHTNTEIVDWYKQNGMSNLKQTTKECAFVGVKQ